MINTGYFINDIAIANLSTPATEANLNAAITKYEKEVLISVLGYELYVLLLANLATPPYQAIVEGAEFSFEFRGKTVTRKWIGLTNAEKKSLLAYYVYVKYEYDRTTFNSGVGHVTPKVENAVQDNPRGKYANAWNQYVIQSGDHQTITNTSYRLGRPITRKKYFDKVDHTTYEHLNDDPSLFNFMLANISDYPKWEFEPTESTNIFDF